MCRRRLTIGSFLTIILLSVPESRAQARPGAATQPSAVEDPVTFRLVQLASVEQSLKAVEDALVAARRQSNVKTGEVKRMQGGVTAMDLKGGAPVPWQQFYGRTARDFYVRDTVDVQAAHRGASGASHYQAHVESGLHAIKRPQQMDYIYRGLQQREQMDKAEIAAMAGQMDKLLERERSLQLQQSALWARIAGAMIVQLGLSDQPIYSCRLMADEGQNLPGTPQQRAEAIQAFGQFLRLIDRVAAMLDEHSGSDQVGALICMRQNVEQAQKDLSRALLGVAEPGITSELTPLASLTRTLVTVSKNAVESGELAVRADQAGDEQQKMAARGLLQAALVDLANKTQVLDTGLAELTPKWRIKPQPGKLMPQVAMTEFIAREQPREAPATRSDQSDANPSAPKQGKAGAASRKPPGRRKGRKGRGASDASPFDQQQAVAAVVSAPPVSGLAPVDLMVKLDVAKDVIAGN